MTCDFNEVKQLLSTAFIGYIFNFTSEQYSMLNNTLSVTLTAEQNKVFEQLSKLILQQRLLLFNQGKNDLTECYELMQTLLGNDNMAKQMRNSCGGENYLYHSKENGEIFNFFGANINEIYPFLLQKNKFVDFRSFKKCNFKSEIFLDLLSKDDIYKLTKLTPNNERIFKFALYDENGNLFVSVEQSIDSVFYEMVLKCFEISMCKLDISELSVLSEIKNALDTLRKVANGKSIQCSSFCGIKGMGFEEGQIFTTEDIVLRNIARNDLTEKLSSCTLSVVLNDTRMPFYGLVAEIQHKLSPKPKKGTSQKIFGNCNASSYITQLNYIKVSNFYLSALIVKRLTSGLNISFRRNGLFDNSVRIDYSSGQYINISVFTDEFDEIKKVYKTISNCNEKANINAIDNLKNAIITQGKEQDSIMNAFYAWESMFTYKKNTTDAVALGISSFAEVDRERIEDLYDRFRSCKSHGDAFKIKNNESLNEIQKEVINIAIKCFLKLMDDKELKPLKPSTRVEKLREKNNK